MTTFCLSSGLIPRAVAFACAIAACGAAIAQLAGNPGDSDRPPAATSAVVQPPGSSAEPSRPEPVALRILKWDSVARAGKIHRLNDAGTAHLQRAWSVYEVDASRLRDELALSNRGETMQRAESLGMELNPPMPLHARLFPGIDDPESLPKRAPRDDPRWEELWQLNMEITRRTMEVRQQLRDLNAVLFDRMTLILQDEFPEEHIHIPAFLSRTAMEHLRQNCQMWTGSTAVFLRPVDIRDLIEDEVVQALLEDDTLVIDAGDGIERSRLQITAELAAIASDFEAELKDIAIQAMVRISRSASFDVWLDFMHDGPSDRQMKATRQAAREWSARYRASERCMQRIRWTLAASLRLRDTELDEAIDGLYAAHFNEYLRHANWDERFAQWLDEVDADGDGLAEARVHLAEWAPVMQAESRVFARRLIDLLAVEGEHQGFRLFDPPSPAVANARDQRVSLVSDHVQAVLGWRDEIRVLLPPDPERNWIARTERSIPAISRAAFRWW